MEKMADFVLSNAQYTSGSELTSAATGLVSGLGYMVSACSSTVSRSGSNETNATAVVDQVSSTWYWIHTGDGYLPMSCVVRTYRIN